MMRNSAAQATAAAGREIALATMASPDMARAMQKLQAGEALTPTENFHLTMWLQATFRALESYYLHWQAGLVSDEFWQSRREGAKMAINFASDDWWATNKVQFERSFAETIDEIWVEAKRDT